MPDDFNKEFRKFFICIAICALLSAVLGQKILPLVRILLCLGALIIVYACYGHVIVLALHTLFHKNAPQKTTISETLPKTCTTEINYSEPQIELDNNRFYTITDQEMLVLLRYYNKVDEIRTKVKGVTYCNDNGSSRQSILAHCHPGDQLRFDYYQYYGSHAYAVFCEFGQIGNLSAELADEIADYVEHSRHKCLILGEILNISGGYHGEYFGCNIVVTIYEKL